MSGVWLSRLLVSTALTSAALVTPSVVPVLGGGAAQAAQALTLDEIIILVTLTRQRAIEALAGVSVADRQQIEARLPSRLEDVLVGMPGVIPSTTTDDPAIGFNVRGLQDYGRVAVVVDGARQNFEVAQHGPQGKLYLDPALLSEVQVARGPITNIHGSGAIGGVVSLTTKGADDILDEDERFGAVFDGTAGTNGGPFAGSVFLAARPTADFDVTGGMSVRHANDYSDASGTTITDSGFDSVSGLFKATLRPAEGHQIKLGTTFQQFDFISGVSRDYGPSFTSNYDNVVNTAALTGEYSFDAPDNPLINLVASGYWNHGDARTTTIKTDNGYGPGTGMFTGTLGTWSGYDLDTVGFDVHNASEFDAGAFKHILTLGADAFADDVNSTGSSMSPDAGYMMTATGKRQVYGAFAQWEAKYGIFNAIGALRYDGYHTASSSYEGEGQRISPKATVGLTPVEGLTFYGSYAEGYRAPSINEAFVSSYHPGYFFQFLPNPTLKPEVGHTLEAGINVEREGILGQGDKLTFKGNIFQNDVTDYIGLEGSGTCTVSGCEYYQYVNYASVRIRGIELEGKYDAGKWFAEGQATILDSLDKSSGSALDTVLPFTAYASVGARFLEDRLTIAPNVRFYGGAGSFQPYQLVGLNVSYRANENTTASLVLDNILNSQYTPFLADGAGAGFTAKAALKVKLAAK